MHSGWSGSESMENFEFISTGVGCTYEHNIKWGRMADGRLSSDRACINRISAVTGAPANKVTRAISQYESAFPHQSFQLSICDGEIEGLRHAETNFIVTHNSKTWRSVTAPNAKNAIELATGIAGWNTTLSAGLASERSTAMAVPFTNGDGSTLALVRPMALANQKMAARYVLETLRAMLIAWPDTADALDAAFNAGLFPDSQTGEWYVTKNDSTLEDGKTSEIIAAESAESAASEFLRRKRLSMYKFDRKCTMLANSKNNNQLVVVRAIPITRRALKKLTAAIGDCDCSTAAENLWAGGYGPDGRFSDTD